MASISYRVNGQALSARTDNPSFVLTDGDGGYLSLGNPNSMNYDGFFVRLGGARYKTLANVTPITPAGEYAQTTELIVDRHITRIAQAHRQSIALHDDGVVMDCDGAFLVTLDCKRLYDESDHERWYTVERSETRQTQDAAQASIVTFDIDYEKRDAGYHVFVCVMTSMHAAGLETWRSVRYAYDERRGTGSTPWVFDLARVAGHGRVVVAAADSQQAARLRAQRLFAMPVEMPNIDVALPTYAQLAWRSLASLRTKTGVMAGLPWFFHEWSRDELTACGGLLAARQYDGVIRMLDKWYDAVRPDGALPAIWPDEGLPSTDAPGWLGKRTRDLLVRLNREGRVGSLTLERLARWRDASGKLIDATATRIRDGLVWTAANTTWMDTSKDDDGRAGARIEIQALFLALCDAHAHLCTLLRTKVDDDRARLARECSRAVHERLVHDEMLIDGLRSDGTQDLTARPNIFLAHYIAPNLFSNDEWRGFFSRTLPLLWLPWGGLASVEVGSRTFRPMYTGEDVASYHRGDSWYFVNNIAAIALHRVDPDAFAVPARALVSASLHDQLFLGYAGHCSEVSSATQQEACGCHAQAWSASTLLEALLEHDGWTQGF
jgi:hypothetical protein